MQIDKEQRYIEIQELIKEYLSVLLRKNRRFEVKTLYTMLVDMFTLYNELFDSREEELQLLACRECAAYVLPRIELLLQDKKVVSDDMLLQDTYALYRKVYAFVSRRSLSHFIDFMEWDRPSNRKVYYNRKDVLDPFIFYLNKARFDSKLQYVIASFPPSYGKTFTVNYFSAWLLGINYDGSILRLSYGDELVLSSSTSIQELVKSSLYAEVFPLFAPFKGRVFDKESSSEWKIKGADTLASHYARTRFGAVTGVRASEAIIVDDITKGVEESTDTNLHEKLHQKWTAEWYNRKNSDSVLFVFCGTMWSPEDILNKLYEERVDRDGVELLEGRFPYSWETSDGTTAVIRVPLLNEDEQSTCEVVVSTEEAIRLRQVTEDYLFASVYQQDPIPPKGLSFSYDSLRVYQDLPEGMLSTYAYATLDPVRKGLDNVAMPIFRETSEGDHFLVDVLFRDESMSELYDDIVDKIITHNILRVYVESNIDESLVYVLEKKLEEKGYGFCELVPYYATVNKEQRIVAARGVILRKMVFKDKNKVVANSEYGKFMRNFTRYSFKYANRHDDAPDSLASYVENVILQKGVVPKVTPINRSSLGF